MCKNVVMLAHISLGSVTVAQRIEPFRCRGVTMCTGFSGELNWESMKHTVNLISSFLPLHEWSLTVPRTDGARTHVADVRSQCQLSVPCSHVRL